MNEKKILKWASTSLTCNVFTLVKLVDLYNFNNRLKHQKLLGSRIGIWLENLRALVCATVTRPTMQQAETEKKR